MIPIICHLEANIHKIQPCSMLPEVVTSTESDGMSIPALQTRGLRTSLLTRATSAITLITENHFRTTITKYHILV